MIKKINWKVRFKNPVFWITFIPTTATFVYTILSLLGITPSISESQVVDALLGLVTIFSELGILVDPTTAGLGDTNQALGYDVPRADV